MASSIRRPYRMFIDSKRGINAQLLKLIQMPYWGTTMQRKWNIIRKILLKIEQLPTENSEFISNELDGVDNEAVAYHMSLLPALSYND